MADALNSARLIDYSLLDNRILDVVRTQHLDGKETALLEVPREIDRGHAPLGELGIDAIPTEHNSALKGISSRLCRWKPISLTFSQKRWCGLTEIHERSKRLVRHLPYTVQILPRDILVSQQKIQPDCIFSNSSVADFLTLLMPRPTVRSCDTFC